MRYLAALNAHPAAWLLVLMAGGVVSAVLFLVFTSITF
jgi:hypothetical protein